MCGYDRYTWLRSQIYTGKSAILKGCVIFFKMTALRVSIAETLSTVHQSQRACPTLWGRVEKLRAFAFYILIIIILKKLLLKGVNNGCGQRLFLCIKPVCNSTYKSVIYAELCIVFMHRSEKAVACDCP